ncbi:Flagellar biosynthesis protein FlhA [hydrothermal vent metagenome]|uniref:Flagellar biosynthesis protein FlhA n=1 Tax=hydrothermal vent metagenome TaxID=652676 RepID=A0A3B0V2E3_9ZZZZ
MAGIMDNIGWLKKGGEFALPVGIVVVLAVMILPMPPFILDIMLTFNITLSLIILLVAVYVKKPLEFSTFPTILLVSTLFRLSLNVATTRLILLRGSEGTDAAGEVIRSFGSFVVGGNFAVGFIIFAILVIINFMVITKGAGRIAEVAARFTLDAMPGKQMSIDADLNAGIIAEDEARKRREEVSLEADFYGSMDGASKFVRGDAVAGILITLINIGGGLVIGVLQQGMPIMDAASTYTLLTVGDGLVTQIPALIISTAAGIVVSNISSEQGLNSRLGEQFKLHPKPIMLAGVILFIMALVPGLPQIPFFIMSLLTFGTGYLIYKGAIKKKAEEDEEKERAKAVPKKTKREPIDEVPLLDILGLEVGYRIIPLVDESENGELLERIRGIRRQFAEEIGLIVPSVHIKDNLQLSPTGYVFYVKGLEVGRGELMVGHVLALDPGNARGGLEGIQTKDPAFGLPAIWIPDSEKERAQMLGYTVVTHSAIVATHISELIRANSEELLGRQEVQSLLDKVAKTHPKVVEELVPALMNVGGVQKVLQNLLRERVSIRDIQTILEAIADYAGMTKDPDIITEYVRVKLARRISHGLVTGDNTIPAISLSHEVEERISGAVKETKQGVFFAIDPTFAHNLLTLIGDALEEAVSTGVQPVLLVSQETRRFVRKLVEKSYPAISVLSHNEIADNINVQTLKVVRVSDAN